MAQGEITGSNVQEVAELKYEYRQSPKYERDGTPFEEAYCLTRIGKQPDDYNGPRRFCSNRAALLDDGSGHATSCRFHGGNNAKNNPTEHLDPALAPIKHGMYASDKHLQQVFDEADQELYDFVMSWADAYGWPSKQEDPARHDILEQLAIERVRSARSDKYLLEEGEIQDQEIFDEASGELKEIEDENKLARESRLQRNLIIDLMKELGLTPKEEARMGAEESQADAAQQLADVAAEAVLGGGAEDEDGPDFDPDDPMFEDE